MQNLSHVEQSVGTALQDIISHLDGDNKQLASFITLHKAIEIPNGKEKPFILVYVSYRAHKVLLSNLYRKMVMELEKKLKTIVLMVSARNIQSRWIKKNRTQKRPYSRTLTAVYESLLDELLLPGIIIGKRSRVRLDGSTYMKVTIDKSEQHFLEERVNAIVTVYKRLTTRDIQIDFAKDPAYYTLKKQQAQK